MAKRPRKSAAKVDQAAAIEQALGGSPQSTIGNGQSAILRHFSPDEHIAWVESNCYRDVKGKGWQPLRYSLWQRDAICKLWAVKADGTLVYKTIMPCLPRRCGKSEVTGLYDIHRADEYADQLIVIQANSEDQGEDTVLKTIIDTLCNSPAFAGRLLSVFGQKRNADGDIEIQAGLVLFHRTGSVIKVQPAKEATTYGQKIHVYHSTELCKAANDKIYQTGASSTGDAWCGVAIVDSNMGDASNPVAKYVELAEQAEEEAAKAAAENRPANPEIGDPSIGAVYISFADLADVLKRGCGVGLEPGVEPIHPWLDADWVRGRYKQMTLSEFRRNHCNKASGSGEELWTAEQIDPLFIPGLPGLDNLNDALAAITKVVGGDGTWRIGLGLDRAGAFSKLPDRTVLSAVGQTIVPALRGQMVPVYDEHGKQIDAELCDGSIFVLLAAWEYMRHLRDPLWDKIVQVNRMWGIGRIELEQYQASDLAEQCEANGFKDRVELKHMTPQAKQQLVQFTHGLVITRRLFISPAYHVLHSELTSYAEDAAGGGIPSYGGKRKAMDLPVRDARDGHVIRTVSTWTKDDYLESAMWALDAARDAKPRQIARLVNRPRGF